MADEVVPQHDGRFVAGHRIDRRLLPSNVGLVQDVVMYQRSDVDHLHHRRQGEVGVGQFPRGLAGQQQQRRPEHLAPITLDPRAQLVDEALGMGQKPFPLLAFNKLETETDISEHRGLVNLLKGIFGVFRNPTSHAPKIFWPINEQDALDIFSLISLLHRRLDAAHPTGRGACDNTTE